MISDPRSQSEKAADQRLRNQRAEEYNRTMGLVTQPVVKQKVVVQPKVERNPKPEAVTQPKRNRAEYFRNYRQRLKLCPHCGKEL